MNMKIKIEKKNSEKYLILFADDKDVTGLYLSREDLQKIKSNVDEMLEYSPESTGESL